MADVKKAIIVFDDGTQEEYTSFIGEFTNQNDDEYHLIIKDISDAQMALSVSRLYFIFKRNLEKQFSQKEANSNGK